MLTPNDGVRCEVCDAPGTDCCASTKELIMRAPFLYGGPLADAIVAGKFLSREDLMRGLGRLLADNANLEDCTAVVPIPLASRRRFERGYNQSVLIAREVSREHRIPLIYGLKRIRPTARQHERSLADRRTNVAGVFASSKRFSGRVALIDDVITSGETMRSAARVLREAGASEVVALAIARTPRL
ncbi:MAG: ComF family protein [Clostridia bacterium]|nr:ComF family protein [Deltaproteobacteria bacterium]